MIVLSLFIEATICLIQTFPHSLIWYVWILIALKLLLCNIYVLSISFDRILKHSFNIHCWWFSPCFLLLVSYVVAHCLSYALLWMTNATDSHWSLASLFLIWRRGLRVIHVSDVKWACSDLKSWKLFWTFVANRFKNHWLLTLTCHFG